MSRAVPKLVGTSHYHVWTDALHARALAQQAENKWDRGTYVRWTVTTAWTVFELACEDALNVTGIGRRFPDHLKNDIAKRSLPPLDWSRGIWQEVLKIHELRKQYVHVNIPQNQLFSDITEAEQAIGVLRAAIKAIYVHAGKTSPAWVEDDYDRGWDSGKTSVTQGYAMPAGVSQDDPNIIKIAYVYKDRDYITKVYQPGVDVDLDACFDELVQQVRIPIHAVRAYRGTQLLAERLFSWRGT